MWFFKIASFTIREPPLRLKAALIWQFTIVVIKMIRILICLSTYWIRYIFFVTFKKFNIIYSYHSMYFDSIHSLTRDLLMFKNYALQCTLKVSWNNSFEVPFTLTDSTNFRIKEANEILVHFNNRKRKSEFSVPWKSFWN